MKKVLLIAYDDIGRGGLQLFVTDWTKMLSSKYEITIYFAGIVKDKNLKKMLEMNAKKLIVGNHYAIFRRFGDIFAVLKKYFCAVNDMQKIYSDVTFDVVHINTGSVVFAAVTSFIAKKNGIKKIIVHSHSANWECKKRVIHKFVKMLCHKIILSNASNFVACSDNSGKAIFGKENASKVVILQNYIDTKRFSFSDISRENVRKQLNIKNEFVIGHVGRFYQVKNHSFLIDIFEEISRIDKEAKMLLVGKGPLEAEIKEKAKKYRLEDKILFVGESEKVEDYLSVMDVFVLPSQFEGFPISGIEAQTNGLRCVFSDTITRQADILGNIKFLSLTQPAYVWAKEIKALDDKNNLSDRKKASEIIKESGYDLDSIVQDAENLYGT